MKLSMKLIWIAFVLCYSQLALANCNGLSFTVANSTWSFNSNPAPSLQLTVSKNNNSSCSYFLTFTAGGSANYLNRLLYNSTYTIPYQLYKAFPYVNILKDFPAATSSNDVLSGAYTGGGSSSQTLTYSAVLGGTSYARFGSYSDTVTVKLYEGTIGGDEYTLRSSHNVTYNYTMAKLIDLSLVNTGAPFNASDVSQTMNFGTLTVGQVQSFDIVLQYNAGYSLKFSSGNNGQMKNTAGNYYVSYSMTVGGTPISLAGSSGNPVVVSSAAGVSTTGGLRIPVSATITSLGAQAAGTHNDTIAITVTSIE